MLRPQPHLAPAPLTALLALRRGEIEAKRVVESGDLAGLVSPRVPVPGTGSGVGGQDGERLLGLQAAGPARALVPRQMRPPAMGACLLPPPGLGAYSAGHSPLPGT